MKRITKSGQKIKELENQIALLKFQLKEKELQHLPPLNDWAQDMVLKHLFEKLKKQDPEQRLITLSNYFGETTIDYSHLRDSQEDIDLEGDIS